MDKDELKEKLSQLKEMIASIDMNAIVEIDEYDEYDSITNQIRQTVKSVDKLYDIKYKLTNEVCLEHMRNSIMNVAHGRFSEYNNLNYKEFPSEKYYDKFLKAIKKEFKDALYDEELFYEVYNPYDSITDDDLLEYCRKNMKVVTTIEEAKEMLGYN